MLHYYYSIADFAIIFSYLWTLDDFWLFSVTVKHPVVPVRLAQLN